MKYVLILAWCLGTLTVSFSSARTSSVQSQKGVYVVDSLVIAQDQSMDVISQEMITKNRGYVLFKNGVVFDGIPRVPPSEFDVAKSKTLEPKRWGTWSLEGKILKVSTTSVKRYSNWFKTEPGSKGKKLAAYYWTVATLSSGSNLGELATVRAFQGITAPCILVDVSAN